jgi:von Willebrand factor type A domain
MDRRLFSCDPASGRGAMNKSRSRLFRLGITVFLLITFSNRTWGAELTVQIRSPKDGSQVTQEKAYVLIGGKVATEAGGPGYVDIFLVLDVSGSTAQYAGGDFAEFSQLPNFYVDRRRLGGLGLPCAGPERAGPLNLRNSILAAEIVASRRLLSQLNPETTRVGVITFGEQAWLRQRLTHDFEQVRSALDLIYKRGPYGGTNMVDAIRVATDELLGKGESEKYLDSIKALIFFTDGFPTRPLADCTAADTDLAINAAALAGKAGINVHVFALGEEALSNPRAAVGIAKESGGTYTAVTRPADVLAVVDKVSAVRVDSIQVTNETIQQKALQSRLVVDGFFASAVPVVEGLNQIQVLGRASDGSVGRDAITVRYEPGGKRSLELEVFLEREKSLKLEVERLGKTADQIQREVERNREEGLRQSSTPPTRDLPDK